MTRDWQRQFRDIWGFFTQAVTLHRNQCFDEMTRKTVACVNVMWRHVAPLAVTDKLSNNNLWRTDIQQWYEKELKISYWRRTVVDRQTRVTSSICNPYNIINIVIIIIIIIISSSSSSSSTSTALLLLLVVEVDKCLTDWLTDWLVELTVSWCNSARTANLLATRHKAYWCIHWLTNC